MVCCHVCSVLDVFTVWLSVVVIMLYVFRYLQEIGYTDTIIDVRSARVRQLLGLQPQNEGDDNRQMVNGEGTGKRPSEGQGRR